MNNSKIALDNIEPEDRDSFLQRQRGEYSQIVEAINGVEQSEDWQKLKRLVLDGVITTLERKVSSEASKEEVNTPELYRLQGQLIWARKYADLKKLAEFFKTSLENIKVQLKANSTKQ